MDTPGGSSNRGVGYSQGPAENEDFKCFSDVKYSTLKNPSIVRTRQAVTLQRGASQPVKLADCTWIKRKTPPALCNQHSLWGPLPCACQCTQWVLWWCRATVAEPWGCQTPSAGLRGKLPRCRPPERPDVHEKEVVLPTRLLESVSMAWESANFCSASRTKITSVLKCSGNMPQCFVIVMHFCLHAILLYTAGCWNWRALVGQLPQYPRSDPAPISFANTHFKRDLHCWEHFVRRDLLFSLLDFVKHAFLFKVAFLLQLCKTMPFCRKLSQNVKLRHFLLRKK